MFFIGVLSSPFDNPRLLREFSPNAWKRGRRIAREGRVGRIRWMPSTASWRAHVEGEESPFETTLRTWDDGGPRLSGTCTCSARPPCEHVAAMLCTMQDNPRPAGPSSRYGDEPGGDLDALRRWMQQQAAPPEPPAAPRRSSSRLVYVLDLTAQGQLRVAARVAPVRRGGALGPSTPYDLSHAIGGRPRVASYVTDEDRLLWFRLTRLGSRRTKDAMLGRDAESTALLHDLVSTERCYWVDTEGPVLRHAPEQPGRVQWTTDDVGRQRLSVLVEPEPGAPWSAVPVCLPLTPLHFLDPRTGAVGPLALDLPDALAASLVDLPRLEPETTAALPAELSSQLDQLGLPLPVARQITWQPHASPSPRLWLGIDPVREPGPSGLDHARAVVSFDYGPVRVTVGPDYDPTDPDGTLVVGLEVLKAARDLDAEAERLEQLERLGLSRRADPVRVEPTEGVRWAFVCDHAVPELRRMGWAVDIDERFPIQPLHGGEWYLDVSGPDASSDPESNDWFSLELGVEIDGVRIDLLPVVVDAIRSGRLEHDRLRVDAEDVPLRLPDGRWISLPGARLRTIVDTLVELFDERLVDGRLPLSPTDGGRLLAMEGFSWRGDTRLRTLAEQLTQRAPLPAVPVPAGLRATLRDYQRTGLQWMAMLRSHGFGGVLADDMGLGKTVQALAYLLHEKDAGRLDRPCLVVAPRTVLDNWRREGERFTPSLDIEVFHGPRRDALFEGDARPDVVITTYALLHRDPRLSEQRWHVVVLDEAQTIKNPQTVVARAARGLEARQRLALTGTPMENNLDELWSLLAFTTPGLLRSRGNFTRHYRTPIERHGDSRRFEALCARVAPFLLRRTKAQVLTELPPKTESVLSIPLGDRQRDLYESVRMTMETRVRQALRARGLQRSRIVVLDALLKLRQVCCHPALLPTEGARRPAQVGSAKAERLLELLTELSAAGRPTIVFSQFTSMLAIIAERLDALGIEHRSLTGKTRDRPAVIEHFQARRCLVLLVSLKAGGTGINLTAADVVIHYDPWWNPAVEEQATDRAHRIGRQQPVTVYRLICEGTVEQGMLALKARKRHLTGALQRAAESWAEGGGRMDEADIERLLAPLE